jgi:hypothetical protein
MLADLQRGIWTELDAPRVTIDAFRRNLQRTYLDQLDAKINPRPTLGGVVVINARGIASSAPSSVSDVRSALRSELVALRAKIDAAVARAGDPVTRSHLMDARVQVDRILDPNR